MLVQTVRWFFSIRPHLGDAEPAVDPSTNCNLLLLLCAKYKDRTVRESGESDPVTFPAHIVRNGRRRRAGGPFGGTFNRTNKYSYDRNSVV